MSSLVRDGLKIVTDPTQAIHQLIDISMGTPNIGSELASEIDWFESSPSGTKRPQLKAAARNILFELWCRNKIILPMDFAFASSISSEYRIERGTELLRFISSYHAGTEDLARYGAQVEYRITQHSLAWIYGTDWHALSDISVEDVSFLWDELDRRRKSNSQSTTPPSVNILTSVLLDQNLLNFTPAEFEEVVDARAHKATQRAISTRYSIEKTKVDHSHGGPRNYGYFALLEHLEGTQFEYPQELANRWNNLFDEYIQHRVNAKGYEETAALKRRFYPFADYIANHLPQVAHDMGEITPLISAPKDFKTYPYIDQGDRAQFFRTFLDYVRSRTTSPDSLRSYLTPISEFFKWVEYRYGDSEFSHIAGPAFKNPIDVKFNIPRTKKRNGTNKVPVGAETLPHLIYWLYGVEEFGRFLQSRDSEAWKGFELRRGFNDHIIACADYGFEPEYTYMDETYRIEKIPLSLLVGQLEVSAGLNLSALRMVIAALETGLRFQAVQWLDRHSWDSENKGIRDEDSFCRLFVNTDKTKDRAWTTFVPRRVRDLLLRQEADLQRMGVMPVQFNYEDRPHSRFEKVVPLFATLRGRLINDGSYDRFWKICLYAFSGFSHRAQLNLPTLLSLVRPTGKLGQPHLNSKGFLYSQLKIEPIHTPHSVRSTYITRRSGVADHIFLGQQVGQSDAVVTAHYDYPEHNRMIDILEAAEQSLFDPKSVRPQTATIRSGPAVLKAKLANSALRKSFEADRDETIERFRMISLAKSLEDADETGIDLLRNSRSADIVFRDTHICPVGEECPGDVVTAAGEMMRCGVCKLACKSIDHLPAITAKTRAIKGRIRHNSSLFKAVKAAGDRNEEMRSIAQSIETDAYELAGWEQSEIILRDLLNDEDYNEWFLTDEPEIVRDHLKRVVRVNDQQQFLASRILDADAYPAIITDDLRIKAARLMRQVRADDDFEGLDPDADIKSLASAMKARMRAIGLSVDEAGELLKNPSQLSQKPQIKLIAED
ncbi:hypothetical protein SAMN04488523_1334 [Sulfitobacter brevis]|uniref:Phage integrase family protein n=2 Tax=Sulfitobacter brevis TaxID=74348 RepID=A0A1I2GZI0_9RHOB|nr:hypothetical protein SAMN04488523_1334 [Sulfitobacter brevis]